MVDQKARCVDLDGRRIMKRGNITIKVKKELVGWLGGESILHARGFVSPLDVNEAT
jgi:hypothetical protein